MVQVLLHGNRKKEKALTLIETVIALTVLVVVSAAAVSLAVFSTSSLQQSKVKRFFQEEVNSISEYYLSYDEATDFAKAVHAFNGQTVSRGTDVTFYYDGSFSSVSEDPQAAYHMVLDFTGDDSLTITASYRDNTVIFSRSLAR